MNEQFTIQEIVEIAIEIEKNGEVFYSALSESAETAKIRELFKYLSEEENKHKVRFQEILKSVGGYEISEIYYATEYMGYMKALADERVFKKGVSVLDIAKKIKSPKEAINIAIDFEKDSIIFLYEMREMIDENEKEAIQLLLDEERGHIRKLSKLKAEII